MLPRAHRLTSGQEYAAVIRRGSRAGSRSLVVHVGRNEGPSPAPPRVGLVVSRAVGNAVTRNQVKRRLRHLARERLAALPEDSLVVVRALPPAGTATSAVLGADLDSSLARVLRSGAPA